MVLYFGKCAEHVFGRKLNDDVTVFQDHTKVSITLLCLDIFLILRA